MAAATSVSLSDRETEGLRLHVRAWSPKRKEPSLCSSLAALIINFGCAAIIMSDNSEVNSADEKTPRRLDSAQNLARLLDQELTREETKEPTLQASVVEADLGRKTNARPKPRSVKPHQNSMAVISSNIFLYKPDAELPDLTNYLNQTIEVKIERKYISKDNPNVIKRKLWGVENYTSNSDMVCILFHFNKFNYEDFISSKLRDGVNLFISVGKRRPV